MIFFQEKEKNNTESDSANVDSTNSGEPNENTNETENTNDTEMVESSSDPTDTAIGTNDNENAVNATT